MVYTGSGTNATILNFQYGQHFISYSHASSINTELLLFCKNYAGRWRYYLDITYLGVQNCCCITHRLTKFAGTQQNEMIGLNWTTLRKSMPIILKLNIQLMAIILKKQVSFTADTKTLHLLPIIGLRTHCLLKE